MDPPEGFCIIFWADCVRRCTFFVGEFLVVYYEILISKNKEEGWGHGTVDTSFNKKCPVGGGGDLSNDAISRIEQSVYELMRIPPRIEENLPCDYTP